MTATRWLECPPTPILFGTAIGSPASDPVTCPPTSDQHSTLSDPALHRSAAAAHKTLETCWAKNPVQACHVRNARNLSIDAPAHFGRSQPAPSTASRNASPAG